MYSVVYAPIYELPIIIQYRNAIAYRISRPSAFLYKSDVILFSDAVYV